MEVSMCEKVYKRCMRRFTNMLFIITATRSNRDVLPQVGE